MKKRSWGRPGARPRPAAPRRSLPCHSLRPRRPEARRTLDALQAGRTSGWCARRRRCPAQRCPRTATAQQQLRVAQHLRQGAARPARPALQAGLLPRLCQGWCRRCLLAPAQHLPECTGPACQPGPWLWLPPCRCLQPQARRQPGRSSQQARAQVAALQLQQRPRWMPLTALLLLQQARQQAARRQTRAMRSGSSRWTGSCTATITPHSHLRCPRVAPAWR